jgi:hypothetical protein
MIKKVEEGRFPIIYKSTKRGVLNIFFSMRFLLNFGQIVVRRDRLEIKMLLCGINKGYKLCSQTKQQHLNIIPIIDCSLTTM